MLDRQFDRSALDTFDAEPDVRKRVLSGIGDKKTITLIEGLRLVAHADKALCWLTKLGLEHKVIATLTSVAVDVITEGRYKGLIKAIRAWRKAPERNTAKAVFDEANIIRASGVPDWEKGWVTIAALVIVNPLAWLPKGASNNERFLIPKNYDALLCRATEAIIDVLKEECNYGI